MGRPRVVENARLLTIRLDSETVDFLDELAIEARVTRSEAVRRIVRRAVRDIVESNTHLDPEGGGDHVSE